jgi:maleylacetate reductase
VSGLRSFAHPAGVHNATPPRVVFGPGTSAGLSDEVARLGASRALIVTTPGRASLGDRFASAISDRCAGLLPEAVSQVPVELVRSGVQKASSSDADCLVAIGGGSAIGLAKAVALTSGLPIIAVPTTYAGSEMTPVWGETAGGSKSTGTDPNVLPRTVVYDPVLSQHLPMKVTAASVANAIAHCVEAVWTPKADPITETTAVEGARALAAGLRQVLAAPTDLDARSNLLYGACLGGSALATAGTDLHHKICHLLGGTYNLPHAETHAAVLPQVARIKAPAVPQAKARLEDALQTDDLATGLYDLFTEAGIPTNLKDLGLTQEQAHEAARSFDADEILARAWAGTRPEGVNR